MAHFISINETQVKGTHMYVTPLPFSPVQLQYNCNSTKEANRTSHSDTKKLDHFKSNEVFLISSTNGNKRRSLMWYKILYSEVILPLHVFSFGIKEQLLVKLQNVNRVKQRAGPQWVASSACDFDQTELSCNKIFTVCLNQVNGY